MKSQIFLLLVLTGFISCKPSTEITKTWKAPGATVTPGPGNKTLIIAMIKDETSRRVVEDELAKRLNASALASYNIIPADLLKEANKESLIQKVTQENFTHVLLMRLADVKTELSYVPGNATSYYSSYGSYYGYGAHAYATPGHYTSEKNYFIETTIYSVNPNKLLWTGTTKTVNPSKLDKTVNKISDVVAKRMKDDGFLK